MIIKTPIYKLKTQFDTVNLYIKREDLLPFSFGGNKARIAWEFFADMESKGMDCMVGYGNARSNLSRVLANVNFSRRGVCHIISPSDDDGERVITNNGLMVHACGAVFHECSKTNVSKTVQDVMDECKEQGLKPYYIYGDKFGNGNEAVPVRAYVKVFQEILKQEEELGVHFDSVVCATGTGMTQAGLIAGKSLYGGDCGIYGISVARDAERARAALDKYLQAYGDSIGREITGEVNISDDYICGGYGKYTPNLLRTIKNMYLLNGIPLDPTYTGKAFYGIQDMLSKNMLGQNVLFIHTGGTPLFFDNLHEIFVEV